MDVLAIVLKTLALPNEQGARILRPQATHLLRYSSYLPQQGSSVLPVPLDECFPSSSFSAIHLITLPRNRARFYAYNGLVVHLSHAFITYFFLHSRHRLARDTHSQCFTNQRESRGLTRPWFDRRMEGWVSDWLAGWLVRLLFGCMARDDDTPVDVYLVKESKYGKRKSKGILGVGQRNGFF